MPIMKNQTIKAINGLFLMHSHCVNMALLKNYQSPMGREYLASLFRQQAIYYTVSSSLPCVCEHRSIYVQHALVTIHPSICT